MGIVFFIVIANFLVFGIAYEYLVFMVSLKYALLSPDARMVRLSLVCSVS